MFISALAIGEGFAGAPDGVAGVASDRGAPHFAQNAPPAANSAPQFEQNAIDGLPEVASPQLAA